MKPPAARREDRQRLRRAPAGRHQQRRRRGRGARRRRPDPADGDLPVRLGRHGRTDPLRCGSPTPTSWRCCTAACSGTPARTRRTCRRSSRTPTAVLISQDANPQYFYRSSAQARAAQRLLVDHGGSCRPASPSASHSRRRSRCSATARSIRRRSARHSVSMSWPAASARWTWSKNSWLRTQNGSIDRLSDGAPALRDQRRRDVGEHREHRPARRRRHAVARRRDGRQQSGLGVSRTER